MNRVLSARVVRLNLRYPSLAQLKSLFAALTSEIGPAISAGRTDRRREGWIAGSDGKLYAHRTTTCLIMRLRGSRRPPDRAHCRRRRIAMADIFISYAHEDRERAQQLAEALQARGWTVWLDRGLQLNEGYDTVVEQKFDAALCVLVLWSGSSAKSEWVGREATRARECSSS